MKPKIKQQNMEAEFYTSEGCHIVEISNGGDDLDLSIARARVEPGEVVIIPPMCRQRITNTGPEDLVFLAICTPPFLPDNYVEPGD